MSEQRRHTHVDVKRFALEHGVDPLPWQLDYLVAVVNGETAAIPVAKKAGRKTFEKLLKAWEARGE